MQTGELHRLLGRLHRTHYRRSFSEFSKFGITQGQPRILNFLARCDGCIQKDLAENCKIEPATVTSVLTTMEKAGLIRREADPEDKRALRVYLTDAGREAQEKVTDVFEKLEIECFRGFSDEEKLQTMDFLQRMYDNMTLVEENRCRD